MERKAESEDALLIKSSSLSRSSWSHRICPERRANLLLVQVREVNLLSAGCCCANDFFIMTESETPEWVIQQCRAIDRPLSCSSGVTPSILFSFFCVFLRTRPQLRDVVVRGNAGDGAAEGASHRVRQLQQTPAEPHLPAWNSSRLVQLYAARVLERRLPAGGAQLSDTW